MPSTRWDSGCRTYSRSARLLLTVAALAPAACGKPAEPPLTPRQLAAQAPWDLGPDTLDVSGYPADVRKGYDDFQARCGLCHTPARPLNLPASGAVLWTKYVQEMHWKSGGVLVTPAQAERIAGFLTYDGERRKRTPEFQKQTRELEGLYKRVLEARKQGG